MKYVEYNTDDIIIDADDKIFNSKKIEEVRTEIYKSMSGEDAEVAVCVLMWTAKRMDKVNNCINSILEYTKNIKYKLVLCNNGGGKEIIDYFESIDHNDKLIINITKNVSATHGWGIIMRFVHNRFCVQVLNDCVVTQNWLSNLMKCIKSDDKIGMVCPASTNVSNLQNVNISNDSSIEDVQKFAVKYNKSNPLLWEERMRLMPICGLYRREVFDQIGIYDPGYLHEFADDDISLRIRRSGYKLILCKDTMVHHDHMQIAQNQTEESIAHTLIGREGFFYKYNGIDAWDDFINFVLPLIHNLKLEIPVNEKYMILGIDVKCGTPILDVKNMAKRNGALDIKCHAFTTDVKYYTDLISVSEKVEHSYNIDQIEHYFDIKYNFIVVGYEINKYEDPMKIMKLLLRHIKPGGYILINLKNPISFEMFLSCLGYTEAQKYDGNNNLSNDDFTKIIYECGGQIEQIFAIRKNMSQETEQTVKKEFYKISIINGNKEEIFEKLCTECYWYLIKN